MAVNDHLRNVQYDRQAKSQLKQGSPRCQCADCGLFFSGWSVFDKHLAGQGTANIRCKSQAEMLAAGMVRNEHGVWLKGGRALAEDVASC